jgi:hypothetical protein
LQSFFAATSASPPHVSGRIPRGDARHSTRFPEPDPSGRRERSDCTRRTARSAEADTWGIGDRFETGGKAGIVILSE